MTTRAQTPFAPAVPPTRGTALSLTFIVAALLALGIAGLWTYLARQKLAAAISADNQNELARVHGAFGVMRGRTQDALRAQCRVLAEDPRLKATLAIEGMDEATIADILNDLRLLQRSGFLMVLSPDGHVFAQSGAEELRGVDLASSSVVQSAKTSSEAVVGSWVIGKQIMDLGAMPIRSDSVLLAYLVVGQAIDKDTVTSLATATGVAVGIGVGNEISIASSEDPHMRAMFTSIAHDVRRATAQVVSSDGESYVTAFIELAETQTRTFLVVARSLQPSTKHFELIGWLLWMPPGLVLLALMISRARSKQVPRMSRSGGV